MIRMLRLDDNKIRIFGSRRANVASLDAREPRVEELVLLKSVETDNLSLNRAAIRWMSVKSATATPTWLGIVQLCRLPSARSSNFSDLVGRKANPGY